MNLDNVNGVPTHPLVVHAAIVLVPLVLACLIVFSFKKKWHSTFAIPTLVLAFGGLVASWLAEESGGSLEERIKETNLVEEHAELGENFVIIAFILFIFVAIWAFIGWRNRNKTEISKNDLYIRIAVSIVAILIAGYASFAIYEVGHSGAKSVWENTPAVGSGED
jgi:uncharacterized membrane protein